MAPHAILVLLLAVLTAIAACGEGPTEEVRLVDYDFGRAHDDSLYGDRWGQDVGVHWFSTGWSEPRGGGLWSRGSRSEAVLHLEGRRATLHMVLTTPYNLARDGQNVTLGLNGQDFHTFVFDPARIVDTLQVALPDQLWSPGPNVLSMSPSRWIDDPSRPQGDFGFALRELSVTAQLTTDQRRRWDELTQAPSVDPGLDPLRLPDQIPDGERLDPQPDLLVFLMDTTRPGHLSTYGYQRRTSPVIDRLAQEGVKLESVIAEAPYTLNSVPSLLTGRSWREHQVIHRGDALSDDFHTLAEVLQLAGYETFAYSDNPNMSRATNTDQGFDEFYEMWRAPDDWKNQKKSDYQPEMPEERFAARLQQGIPQGPVFFYVHTMQPHAPYFPGHGHDLWEPASYRGNITGTVAQMQEFDQGKRPPHGPDHTRLVSLYDGSIHRGDASIGRMLDAWKALGRTRPVMVVFVSDHGEAFGEHGRFSHNTTPYDEMVHVPAVFHPASLVPGLEKSTGALRTLSDVMPIILHYLRVPLPAGTSWPAHALAVLRDPSVPRESIFIRCREPLFAVRTATSLTVLDGFGRQEYYALDRDPAAATNLRREQPQRYVEQAQRLRAFIEHPFAGTAPAAAELAPEDIEKLKALGYM